MKKYKTVVFDIDNTLTLLEPLLETIAFYFKCTPIKAHEAQHFSLAKTYGLTKEQEDYFWNENEWFMHAGAQLARERVDKIFSEYLEEDATIYILIARGPEHSNITRKWLDFNNMPYNEVFCIGKESKVAMLEELQAEAIFEDNPDFFFELWDKGLFPTVDGFCIDYPYNQHVPCKFRLHRDTAELMEAQEVLSDVYRR